MERSEQIGDLVAALAKAQGEFTAALKESINPSFGEARKYRYADLASNIGAVRPALSKNGIALLQFDGSDLERQTASVTTALHYGEQFISMTAEAPAVGRNGFDVQSLGACWTYLRRYTLQALCGLASEDDDASELSGTDNKPIPAKQPAEKWAAQEANKAKAPSLTPTNLEGNILTGTVKEIKSGTTKAGKEYRAVVLEDSIAIVGAPKPFDTVWVWHQSMWADLEAMPGKECEFMVAQSDKGLTLNTILRIGSIEWTESKTEGEAQ